MLYMRGLINYRQIGPVKMWSLKEGIDLDSTIRDLYQRERKNTKNNEYKI